MAKRLFAFILLGFASTALPVGTPACAQDARLQGVFVNPAQSDKPIKNAVDAAAKEFNFLLRPIARSRLNKTNPNITRVSIARASDDITVQLGTSKPATARAGGPAVKWSRDDEAFDLTIAWDGAVLTQSFSAPDGTRINRYTLSLDGNSLLLESTIISDQLKKPMKYWLAFKREGAL